MLTTGGADVLRDQDRNLILTIRWDQSMGCYRVSEPNFATEMQAVEVVRVADMISDDVVEQMAREMWDHLADKMADPERSVCRNGPITSGREKGGWRPLRWDETDDGAWKNEMRDMARLAVANAMQGRAE